MNGCQLIRVVTKDDEECFLLTKLKNGGKEGITLTVCHNGHVWTGEVSEDDLDSLSSRLKMDVNKYVSQTVEALTCLSDAKHYFQYQLKRGKDRVDFIWKKHVPSEDITFQLGSASLKAHEDSTRFITQMFEHCIQTMSELKEQIHTLETDNERLAHERMNALKRLEKCVVAKEELEQEMYTKFSQVLNSKKEKIRELKRQVEEGIREGSVDSVPESSTQTSRGKRHHSPALGPAAQSKSGSDIDTEEDTPESKRSKGSGKTGGKKKVQSKGDESLELGQEEEEVTAPAARPRRQRGRPQQQKKQPASKPVLPRVGSNESANGDRKPRLRKSASGHSNRSSDNIDDLFEQL